MFEVLGAQSSHIELVCKLASFRTKSHEILTKTFFSGIDGKR